MFYKKKKKSLLSKLGPVLVAAAARGFKHISGNFVGRSGKKVS